MTLNPIVQMGRMSLLIFALVGIAWGAMPVNPHRFRHRRFGDAVVSAAGPAVNLFLVLFCAAGVVATSLLESAELISAASKFKLIQFFRWGGLLNVLLAGLNLLPVPPLDGSRILGCLFPPFGNFARQPAMQAYGILFALVIIYGSDYNYWEAAHDGFAFVANLMGSPFGVGFK